MKRAVAAAPAAFLLAVALLPWAPCLAQETSEGVAEEREVPEPRLPGVEQVPEGEEPGTWRSWATGQDVDRLTRVRIEIQAGSGTFAPTPAGSGTGAPDQNEFNDLEFSAGIRIGLDLAPSLGLVLGGQFYLRDDGHWDVPGPSGSLNIQSKDDGDLALFLGIRLSLPFAHLGGRPFRFSRAEAPTGFAFHVLVGGGFALLGGMNLYYTDPSDMSYQDRPYWKSSTGVCFAFGARIEYRWVNFAVFLDFTAVNLGEPEPTDDPEWAASAEAGPVVPLVGSLGISVHF